jgi:hypothetical protein
MPHTHHDTARPARNLTDQLTPVAFAESSLPGSYSPGGRRPTHHQACVLRADPGRNYRNCHALTRKEALCPLPGVSSGRGTPITTCIGKGGTDGSSFHDDFGLRHEGPLTSSGHIELRQMVQPIPAKLTQPHVTNTQV